MLCKETEERSEGYLLRPEETPAMLACGRLPARVLYSLTQNGEEQPPDEPDAKSFVVYPVDILDRAEDILFKAMGARFLEIGAFRCGYA